MSAPGKAPRFLDFDGCRLEVESGDVVGPGGRTARLAPQPTRLLALLAARPGRLVTRDEIAEELWPHGSVEIDQGIGYAVREVRKAIEAAGGDPSVVETVPRRGFRVRPVAEGPEATSTATATATEAPPAEVPMTAAGGGGSTLAATGVRTRAALGVVAVLALVAGVAVIGSSDTAGTPPVVVVFEHRTAADEPSRVAAGELGTTLTTRLTRDHAGRLGVIGPTGTASLTGPDDTEGARTRLGACLVLSGSLRTVEGTGTVVFTQIVRTSDRVHVWASTDTMPAPSPLASTDSMVTRIVSGLEAAAVDCAG